VIGELTEEDLPRPKKDRSLVSMGGGAGSGVWSGTPEDLDKYMRENGMPSIFGTDSDDDETSETAHSSAPNKKSADELIEDMLNGNFEGDPIEGLFEIGKALAEEPDTEDEKED
jgi:hypothetical protein